MAETPLKVMGLSGSIGRTSKNGMLVDLALQKAEALGAEVHFWDLESKPLPLVGEDGCWSHPNVKEFKKWHHHAMHSLSLRLNITERCQV